MITRHASARFNGLFAALVEQAGQVVSKKDLCAVAWPNMVVEEGSLRFHIASLRKALGAHDGGDDLVKTIAGRGYCFTGKVRNKNVGRAFATQPVAHALPSSPRRIIGGEAITREIAEDLTSRRFLTLVGPPGIGKTTLALQVARQARPISQAALRLSTSVLSMLTCRSSTRSRGPCRETSGGS